MFSIYTSLYNLNNGFIDWKDALDNFCAFADEIVISTIKQEFHSDEVLLGEYRQHSKKNIKLIVNDISFDDLDFDGKLKNAALKACTQEFCILLDGDERIDSKDKENWVFWADQLRKSEAEALFVPVIDLFNTEKEYKSVGQKWYLHKNLPHLNRGIVNFAKKGDKIDHTKSDTCELIDNDGNLCKSASVILAEPMINKIRHMRYPIKIWHLGWLDRQKRLKSNAWWQRTWDNRAGFEVKDIIHSEEQLDKIEYFPHGLKLWYE